MNFKLKKSDLNFKVYTVEVKPTTPGAENDIAIISSVPMSNWLMSPEAPSGTPRNDGDVWIQYSTTGSTKNILKQNALMIATIKAWQYVDGAWVDREAVSCRGGEWVDWIIYLYNMGNDFESLTGGWTEYIHISSKSTTYSKGTCENTDSGLIVTIPGNKYAIARQTVNAIDLTNVNTIKVYAETIGSTDGTISAIWVNDKNKGPIIDDNVTVGVAVETFGVVTLDSPVVLNVSTLSGKYYVGIYKHTYAGGAGKTRIVSIIME